MEIKQRNIDSIKPYNKNAKTHDKKQINNVAESIKQFGWQQPIVVDADGVIIVGHCRYEAAKKLKLQEVPCVVADGLTEEQVQKYRLLDNKTNESDWDMELLAEDLFGLDFSGFDVEWGIAEKKDPDENNPYTKTVNLPQYEVKGLECGLGDLFDSSKVEMLIKNIENSSVSDEEKKFLKIAAYRHCVINFDLVAEYYAKSNEEMQKLMEESALVLIDYNDAIANGFTELSDSLDLLREEDSDA